MTIFEVEIKEKQKFIQRLNFPQLNGEIYGFMYKKTILEQSRDSLGFYILIFFLLFTDNKGNTLLYSLFENNLEKVKSLNNNFSRRKRNLMAWEYTEFKKDAWLADLFYNDIFFILIKCIANIEKIFIQYNDFFKQNPYFKNELEKIDEKFSKKINEIYYNFHWYKIDDKRLDDNWNELDLSKSVSHTINMRMSKRIDLTLTLNTDIKSIKSQSPIDVILLQSIDPTIVFDIWDKYHLFEYVKNIWDFINQNPVVTFIVCNYAWDKYKLTNTPKWKDKISKKKRNEAERQVLITKKQAREWREIEKLLAPINQLILNSQLNLEKRIELLEQKIEKFEKQGIKVKNKKNNELEQLKDEVKKLKNLEVNVKEQWKWK